jgi:hypothetical protein
MATILLSAAGAAVGAGFGGTALGLSGAVIGRAIGATVGRVIDQRILGNGSEAVEVGKVERFRLMGASEGAAIPQVWGRVRVAGQVIWSSRFLETATRSGGSKGVSRSTKTTQYSYSVSLAIALCEGKISRVGRIWADGNEIEPERLNLRVYEGSETQLADPKIEAVEGAGNAPSYRGTAYVVIEDLDLSSYGNRIPQLSFEVIRPARGALAANFAGLDQVIPGVCMIPGTGEYALATTPVHYAYGVGVNRSANVHSMTGKTDMSASLDALSGELPNATGASLVVSWFGDDLRCGSCAIQPKVEQADHDGVPMSWTVSGLARTQAALVPRVDQNPVYGGTPADASVTEAITALNAAGKAVTFYPFILMEQLTGNGLPNPWNGSLDQPELPWRGRITLNQAPGQAGSADRSAAAASEVAAFFGTAAPSDFAAVGQVVNYSGPPEWRYRRFILHYAHLCAAAGGVAAFCIGSEMRGLTQIRGAGDSFPAVAALRTLAQEVKTILGSNTKITYAADWSEYFGYHVDGNVYFHLDDLWADPAIDFIGIDNYMPLSDWRDGETHADAAWGDIYNRDYLRANIAGGEGYDWYYADEVGATVQNRLPISDGAHDEPWVFRAKDIKGWWSSSHHQRIDGVRLAQPTAWIAGSKPIRFTEFGCAAIDKGTNQPNRFLDPKSSESALPRGSNGLRDDLLQLAYYQAMHSYWTDPQHNPAAYLYEGSMVDFGNSLAWAWDARPFPAFPAAATVWSDGGNYDKGHWLNGRSSNVDLSAVLSEICQNAGLDAAQLDGVRGVVRGYSLSEVGTSRSAIQPLLLAYPSDVIEREGILRVQGRKARGATELDPQWFVRGAELDGAVELQRSGSEDMPAHLAVSFIEAEVDFPVTTASAVASDRNSEVISQTELPLLLTVSEARSIAERWLTEAEIARDTIRFVLPKSQLQIGVGDTVKITGQTYRIDRAELSETQLLEGVRMDAQIYQPTELVVPRRTWQEVSSPVPVHPVFLDLPLMTGTEVPYAPHACAIAAPWPGAVAIWSSQTSNGFALNTILERSAIIGVTETPLSAAAVGVWDRGAALRVRIESGNLFSTDEQTVLAGGNLAAIGYGSAANWELFQFTEARLVAPKTYEISMRLRGQLGSDAVMPPQWPVGSTFVFIDTALAQIELPDSARGLERQYRFVAADQGYDDPSAVALTQSFEGIGLRPYAVAHLRAQTAETGDVNIGWLRRTRIGGDSWQSFEVPLSEESEAYVLRIYDGATLKRQEVVSQSAWVYTAALQSADATQGVISVHVAQFSSAFGAGPFRTVEL